MFLGPRVLAYLGRSEGAGPLVGSNRLTRLAAITERTIENFAMIRPGQRVLVAFSGGPDSTALMLVMRELGYEMDLAHVDHGMRPESARDGVHCAQVASRLGVGFHLQQATPAPSNESEARDARYRILHGLAEVVGADVIATGHTRDDQAETVRMRLDRGGFGLGIPPKRGKIVRPIIEATKEKTIAVCQEAAVGFLTDATNEDLRLTRNRIRDRLRHDPSERERLIEIGTEAYQRTSESAARLEEALQSSTISLTERQASIDRQWISSVPPDHLGSLLAGVIRKLGAEPHRSSIKEVSRIITQTGKQVSLGEGLTAWTDATSLNLGPLSHPTAWPETRLEVPGETVWGRWRISLSAGTSVPKIGTELIDRDAVGPNLWVRAWKPGDRFRPLSSGAKKLQDLFTDHKVPRIERSNVPVIHDGKDIIWVAGFRIAEVAKITSSTTRFLEATCVDVEIDVAG